MVIRIEPCEYAKGIERTIYAIGDQALDIIDDMATSKGVIFSYNVVVGVERVRQGILHVTAPIRVWCAIGEQCGEILATNLN